MLACLAARIAAGKPGDESAIVRVLWSKVGEWDIKCWRNFFSFVVGGLCDFAKVSVAFVPSF